MKDLTGQKFNKLTVLAFSHFDKKKNSYWLCRCDCGNEKIVRRSHLLTGNVQSCGCIVHEARGTYKNGWRKHGLWSNNKRLCKILNCMLDRCYNKNNFHYKDYGERGISVCETWRNSFESFVVLAKENGYSDDLSIDRIDNNGNYEPENCRWATQIEQANNKRNNVFITYNGKTQTIAQWSREIGIGSEVIRTRFHKGLKPEDIFNKIKGFSVNRTFLEYNGEIKSITAWSKILHIKLKKLKRLLKKYNFNDICYIGLTK